VKQDPLWKISVVTLPEAEDAVTELMLDCLSQTASSYTDVQSGETTVTVYLERKPSWPAVRAELATGIARIKSCGLKIGAGKVSLQKIRREDWAESWKKHFKPLEIGDTLLVKPSWSKRRAKKNQAVVILDPGLSFGTGQHPTTSFCLQQLAKHRSEFRVSGFESKKRPGGHNSKLKTQNPKQSFLDIGTGSGILAIAAAKLGYSPVEAFDFDPEAVRVARANARRNRVCEKILIRQADVTKRPKRGTKRFDVVCANLLSSLLISHHHRIKAKLKPGGVLVLAGILAKEFFQVQSAFEKAGCKMIASRAENEWRSGAFCIVC
jgi:ribosomal protein L11 methyltransferase